MDRVVSTGPFSLRNEGRRQLRDQHQRHLWPYQQKLRAMEAKRRRMAQFRGVVLMRGATEEDQRVTESVRTSVNIPLASTEFATTPSNLAGGSDSTATSNNPFLVSVDPVQAFAHLSLDSAAMRPLLPSTTDSAGLNQDELNSTGLMGSDFVPTDAEKITTGPGLERAMSVGAGVVISTSGPTFEGGTIPSTTEFGTEGAAVHMSTVGGFSVWDGALPRVDARRMETMGFPELIA